MNLATTLAPLLRGCYLNQGRGPVILKPTRVPADKTIEFSIDNDALEALASTDPVEVFGAQTTVGQSLAAAFDEDLPVPGVVEVKTASGSWSWEVSSALQGTKRSVDGRISLVTGGAQGFGEEIVRGLLEAGSFVYIADLNIKKADELREALEGEGYAGRVDAIAVNVGDDDSVKAMFDEVALRTGGLDLVVASAGVLRASSVLSQPTGDFTFVTDINYVGFFILTKFGGQLMRCQNITAPTWLTDIIQINSKSGLEGSNRNGAYAGSKFGGLGLVQSFAKELVIYGIKVNAICPGNFLDGPLWSDPVNGLFVQYLNSGKVPGAKDVADVRRYYESLVPMNRGAYGIDVLRAVFYLVEQTYETGQALPVTGGQVMLN